MPQKTRSKPAAKRTSRYHEGRRNYVRIEFEGKATVLWQEDSDPQHARRYETADLSIYGLSFRTTKDEKSNFKLGSSCHALTFQLDGRPITVAAKVVHLYTKTRAKQLLVGVEFTRIADDDVWYIARVIAEKSGASRPRIIHVGVLDTGSGKVRVKQHFPNTRAAKVKAKPKAVSKKVARKPKARTQKSIRRKSAR